MDTKYKAVLGHLLALFVTIVWGSAFVSTKVLLRAFHPIEIIIFRFLIAWAVLFLCSPKPLLPKSWKSELPFIGAGLTGLTLYFMLENFALSYTFASNVGIIIAAAPMFTALLMWACRRTARPRWTFFAGFVIAIAGITLVSLSNGEAIGFGPLGDLLTLGAAFSWGAYGVLVEAVQPQGYTDLQATRKIFFWGLVFTFPWPASPRRKCCSTSSTWAWGPPPCALCSGTRPPPASAPWPPTFISTSRRWSPSSPPPCFWGSRSAPPAWGPSR